MRARSHASSSMNMCGSAWWHHTQSHTRAETVSDGSTHDHTVDSPSACEGALHGIISLLLRVKCDKRKVTVWSVDQPLDGAKPRKHARDLLSYHLRPASTQAHTPKDGPTHTNHKALGSKTNVKRYALDKQLAPPFFLGPVRGAPTSRRRCPPRLTTTWPRA